MKISRTFPHAYVLCSLVYLGFQRPDLPGAEAVR